MPDRSTSPSSRLNRWLALALIVSTLALLAWLGWRAARTALYARAALDDLDRLQSVLANPSLCRGAQGPGRPREPANSPKRGSGCRPPLPSYRAGARLGTAIRPGPRGSAEVG